MFVPVRIVFACALGLLAFGERTNAQDAPRGWKVDRASGEVWVVNSGAQNAALTRETNLKSGDSVRTGPNGRVMLRRGQETILISPNSAVGLPAEAKAGATTIIQQAGSILLEVNKRDARTFEVETPYLVAAVKGTQFRVTVGAKGADVNVQHGSVEVADVKSGKFALVLPGQSANVSAIGAGGLSLRGLGTLSPIQNGAPRPSSVGRILVPRGGLSAPASIRASLQNSSGQTARAGGNVGGLRIAAPIGQVRLDVHTATRGLARETGVAAQGRSVSTIWSENGRTTGIASAAATNSPGLSSVIGASVSPAINSGRPAAAVAASSGNATGNAVGANGNGYAYGGGNGSSGQVAGNSNGNNGNAIGGGNGQGNNGNGNGNGGSNGSNASGNGNGNSGNSNGNSGNAFGVGNGNGGGNGQGNNGNGNGNGGSNRTGR